MPSRTQNLHSVVVLKEFTDVQVGLDLAMSENKPEVLIPKCPPLQRLGLNVLHYYGLEGAEDATQGLWCGR